MLFDNILEKNKTITSEFSTIKELVSINDNINYSVFTDLDKSDEIYVSSDLHLFDNYDRTKLLLKYHYEILDNSNKMWICCGDLTSDTFTDKEKLKKAMEKIVSKKILILGNNDVFPIEYYKSIGFNHVLKILIWRKYIFTHDILDIKNVPDFFINVHGHLHGMGPRFDKEASMNNRFDVFPDINNFKPYLLSNINILVQSRKIVKEDAVLISSNSDYIKNILGKNLYNFLEYHIFSKYSDSDKDHVRGNLQRLATFLRNDNINTNIARLAITAMYFHDIGLTKQPSKDIHHIISKEMVLKNNDLKKYFNADEINIIATAVFNHKEALFNSVNIDVVSSYVIDADREYDIESIVLNKYKYYIENNVTDESKILKNILNYITSTYGKYNNIKAYTPSGIKELNKLKQFAQNITIDTIKKIIGNNELYSKIEGDLGEKPFAVFALYYDIDKNMVAATTRPLDKDGPGRIGLPGGKIDEGEDIFDALRRECKEEGWDIDNAKISKTPIHKDIIDGHLIFFYEVDNAIMLDEYKEKSRGINPIFVTIDDITTSGYGNHFIKDYISKKYNIESPQYSNIPKLVNTVNELFKIIDSDDIIDNDDLIITESPLTYKERSKLPDKYFGIPELRKYPLYDKNGNPDITHIRSAMSMFSKCPHEYRYKLAKNILKAAKKAKMKINENSEWYRYATLDKHTNTKNNKNKRIDNESTISNDLENIYDMNITGIALNIYDEVEKYHIQFEKNLDEKLSELKDRKNGVSDSTETLSEGPDPEKKDEEDSTDDSSENKDSSDGGFNFGDDNSDTGDGGFNFGDDNSEGDSQDSSSDSNTSSYSSNAQPPNKLILFKEYYKILNILNKIIKNIETNQYIVNIDNIIQYIATLKSIRNDVQYIMDKCFLTMDYSELLVQFTTIQKRVFITIELLKRFIQEEK